MAKNKSALVKGDRIELQYGLYQIIAGEVGDAFKAIAYVGRRRVAESNGDAAETTINSLKSYLDVRTANHRQGRKGGVPTPAEFRDAFAAVCASVPPQVMELLASHSRLPGEATVSQLAKMSLGHTPAAVEVAYMRVGRKLSKLLAFYPEAKGVSQQLAPMLVLAVPAGSTHRAAWKLRTEIVQALAELRGRAPITSKERAAERNAESSVA